MSTNKIRDQTKYQARQTSPRDDTDVNLPEVIRQFGKHGIGGNSRATKLKDEEQALTETQASFDDAGTSGRDHKLFGNRPVLSEPTREPYSYKKLCANIEDAEGSQVTRSGGSMDAIIQEKKTDASDPDNTTTNSYITKCERDKGISEYDHRDGPPLKDKSTPYGKATKHDDDNGEAKNYQRYTIRNQIRNTVFYSRINLLLVLSPVGIAVHYAGVNVGQMLPNTRFCLTWSSLLQSSSSTLLPSFHWPLC